MKMRMLAAAVVSGAVAVFLAGPMRASDGSGHEGHEGRHGAAMEAGDRHVMPCPAHVEGSQVKVTNTKDGVVINITAKDPETVKMIQVAAAHMGMKHAGCAHCGQGATPGQNKAKAAQGQAKEATYACSMGCYKGPNTKDGRCPKCGMNLEKK
ncbi:MAG: hypothetical protein HY927_08930 [Elusimicrobia bacterium]|nr:hypothetical protein [Elusimicrobiota bacterium]